MLDYQSGDGDEHEKDRNNQFRNKTQIMIPFFVGGCDDE